MLPVLPEVSSARRGETAGLAGARGLAEPLPLLGDSAAVLALRREIDRAVKTDATVLILGETGSGKEIVSRLIHAGSRRAARGFIPVNCSGIPETLLASVLFGHARGSFTGAIRDSPGLLRQADRGTLFLDELGEMSLGMQAAMLRFTDNGEIQPVGALAPVGRVDVRLLTATNRDLRERISAGVFREDLYYRLNIIEIRVPALRDRDDDAVVLFQHYLDVASAAHGVRSPRLEPCAIQRIREYAWPGNVRELKNVTERMVLRDMHAPVTADDLPAEMGRRSTGRAVPGSRADRRRSAQADRRGAGGAGAPPHDATDSQVVDQLWRRMMEGGDFWTVVREPFRAHEVSRVQLAALVDRGLRHTAGSYRALVALFNLPAREYKRFHAFLYAQHCNIAVSHYRPATFARRALRAVTEGTGRRDTRAPREQHGEERPDSHRGADR